MGLLTPLGWFNLIEWGIWTAIGAVLISVTARSRPKSRQLGLVAGIAMSVFGITDLFEIASGAWWRPWPLLLAKGVCLGVLLGCGILARRRT